MDSFTTNLNMRVPEVGGAEDTWGESLNGDLYILDGLFAPDGDGTPAGFRVGADKTLNVEGTGLFNALKAWFVEGAKRMRFRTDTLPDGDTTLHAPPVTDGEDTLVAADAVQDLRNKNLIDCTAATPTGASPNAVATVGYVGSSALLPGTVIECWRSVEPAGFLWCNGKTIGNAASGATARANADTWPLFNELWQFTTLTVSGGRGVNARTDFDANKTITVPDRQGRVAAGWDQSSTGRLTTVNAAIPGSAGGAQTTNASIGGTASGSLSVSTVSYAMDGPNTLTPVTGGDGRGGGADHTHANVRSTGSTSGTLNVTGGTGDITTVQPTIISPFLIKL